MKCNICPRQCNVDRSKEKGYCGQKDKLRISKVMFHHYEEPIISGNDIDRGSGAIFFTGCNLKCVYCQNYPISHGNKGKNISVKRLIKIIKKLELKGALNINLVTPSHFTREIVAALKIYKPSIPIVWNSSGYESSETIELLRGLVDIFLVDLKYFDNSIAKKYSLVHDYVERSNECIRVMKSIQPKDEIVNGLMKKGIIIRHLVLPNHTDDSIRCLDYIASSLGKDSIVSIMSQYEPRYDAVNLPEINRKITPLEYKRVTSYALRLGLNNSFIQDLSSANSKYTPKF